MTHSMNQTFAYFDLGCAHDMTTLTINHRVGGYLKIYLRKGSVQVLGNINVKDKES